MKILLVEDNSDDAEIFLSALDIDDYDHDIEIARDGEQALAYVFDSLSKSETLATFDLIILDIKLPKLNGIEVLKKLKTDARIRSVPVVMFTSSNLASDIEQCYRYGANSYVLKPVDYIAYTDTVSILNKYWSTKNVTLKNS